MKRVLTATALSMGVLALTGPALLAEVKTRERAQVKFEGMLGRMMNMFGGKAARDGIVSTNAVKGDRKATLTDTSGRIVDLAEEKVYDLDLKKKTYQVTTFDELRRRLREAEEKAARDAEKQKEREPEQEREPGKEVDVDFDVKETGQTRSIAGHDTRQVIMTVTVREKGRTLEEGGGLVMTTDSWLAPEIPALKELAEFEQRYWKAIAPETAGVSAEQMAAIMALYPMMKQAIDRMNTEKVSMEGTPLATTLTVEGVKSKAQMEQQPEGGGGGLGGMLARRVMKRNDNPRSTIFTAITETQEVAARVAPSDLEIPADFKEKK